MIKEVKKRISFYIVIALIIMIIIQTKLHFGTFEYIKNFFINNNIFNYINFGVLILIGIGIMAIANKLKSISKFYLLSSISSYFLVWFSMIERWLNIFKINKDTLFNLNIISILLSFFFMTKIFKIVRR